MNNEVITTLWALGKTIAAVLFLVACIALPSALLGYAFHYVATLWWPAVTFWHGWAMAIIVMITLGIWARKARHDDDY